MSFTSTARAVGGAALAGTLLLGVAPTASADQIRDDQWALEAFDVEKVWEESTGEGVTVAVLDDAVNGSHPDLRRNVLPGKDMVKGGPANNEKQEDHGTNVAAVIAAHGSGSGGGDGIRGLAPDAKILPVGLNDPKSNGGKYTTYAEAIRYAVDEGAKVINMSFAADDITAEEEKAVAYAASKDVLIVAGAGNDGAGLAYPARTPGVVAVGAISENGNIWEDSNFGKQLMLTAPGENISTAGASEPYQTVNGTSLSTAYVSGGAALVRAKFPDLSAGQVVNRLVKTALLPDSVEGDRDVSYGYGMMRPLRALTEDIPAGSKQGPLEAPEATPPPTSDDEEEAGDAGSGSDGEDDAAGNNQASDDDGMSTTQLVGAGVIGLAVLAGIVGAILFFRKRGQHHNGPPPPGGPGGGPGGPGGPGGAPYGPGAAGQAPPQQYLPPQPPAPGPYPPNQPPQGPPGY